MFVVYNLLDELDIETLQDALRRRVHGAQIPDSTPSMTDSDVHNSLSDMTVGLDPRGEISQPLEQGTAQQQDPLCFDPVLHPLSESNGFADLGIGSAEKLLGSNPTICQEHSHRPNVPTDLVDELIDLFSEKVIGFLPLLDPWAIRSKFHSQGDSYVPHDRLNLEEALLLFSLLALSARFSSSPYLQSTPAPKRGSEFASHASALYQENTKLDCLHRCSLTFLQGSILLAFYQLTCRPTVTSWVTIGACVRFALELGLNEIDRDLLAATDVTEAELDPWEWYKREERRRAWWAVWELDIFVSTTLRRPYAIDMNRVWVLLPVSDFHWFFNTPISSSPMIIDPACAWQTLQDSQNQDERAWFLVSLFLMRLASEGSFGRLNEDKEDLRAGLENFALLLPHRFQLGHTMLLFDESDFAHSNWVIQTLLMVHTASSITDPHMSIYERSRTALLSPRGPDMFFRTIRAWPLEYIALCCPFVVCPLIGPAFSNFYLAREKQRSANLRTAAADVYPAPWSEMMKLVLREISSVWDLGAAVLELVEALEVEESSLEHLSLLPVTGRTTQQNTLASSFAFLLPKWYSGI
ncbi:fungal-specific transcription factor domain-containing protein [Xylogone sp. PMI_703]|nr:fungal-specific transcription factor domain-containing protein [Xylogone sp. PMI_703]